MVKSPTATFQVENTSQFQRMPCTKRNHQFAITTPRKQLRKVKIILENPAANEGITVKRNELAN